MFHRDVGFKCMGCNRVYSEEEFERSMLVRDGKTIGVFIPVHVETEEERRLRLLREYTREYRARKKGEANGKRARSRLTAMFSLLAVYAHQIACAIMFHRKA